MRSLRFLQLSRLLAVLFLSLAVCHAAVAPRERPNVLFLISDDLTANALGCYGNPRVRTPNLDRLAERSLRFDRAYCQFPVCGPARAALMSGRYAQAVGVTGNGAASRFTTNMGRRPTLPEWFKRNGWKTARVSKIYHMRVPGDITAGVDGPDHAASWSERYNVKAPEWMSAGTAEHLTNEKLKFDPDGHYNLGFGGAFYTVQVAGKGAEQADFQAATRAVEWLREHRETPFFLAVGLVRPHVPLVAPEAFFDLHPADAMTLPLRLADDWEDIPQAGISKNSRGSGLEGHEDRQRRVLSAYYAATAFMDAQAGRVLDELDRLGLSERTVVVFTSDHGYHLGEHDFWQKMSLHEESARVPLLLAGPGVRAGVTRAIVEAIDLYPTLAGLAGLEVPGHCQGRNLEPVLQDHAAVLREDAYCHRGNGHLLRTDRWAYLEYAKGGAELYDMRNDPRQFTNLVERAELVETTASLRLRLQERLAAME